MSNAALPMSQPTVTLLVPNMHCPSCVENITHLLSPLKGVSDLNVSLLLRTVTFSPLPTAPSSSKKPVPRATEKEVVDILAKEGGFIVERNHDTRSVSSSRPAPGPAGWIDSLKERWSSTARKEGRERKREEIRRRIHWENCEACREGRSHEDVNLPNPEELSKGHAALRTVISISGMTCASCTQSISTALRSVPDIIDVDVNLLGASATVKHRATFSAEAVKELIEDTGFDAELVSSSETTTDPAPETVIQVRTVFSIEGMTCASCSSAIDNAIRGTEGITEVNIDVLRNKGTVFHSSSLTPETIREMIEDVGYDAAVISTEPMTPRSVSQERKIKVMVHGIYCINCINKLNAHLDGIKLKHTPFAIDNHVTEITYSPRDPYTIRDILAGLSGVSPEFEASVVKQTSLSDRSKEIQKREMRILFLHWIVALAFTIPTFIIGIVGMALLPSGSHFRMTLMRPIWGAANLGTIILWPIATVVQFGVGRLFYERAFASMKPHLRALVHFFLPSKKSGSAARKINWRSFFSFGSMDLLVVLSTTVSYFASLAMLIIDVTSPASLDSVGSYFDSCVFLIMFILLGRVLEAYAKSRTTDAVSLLGQLRPETALLVEQVSMDTTLTTMSSSSGQKVSDDAEMDVGAMVDRSTRSVPVEHLEKGDLILIPPGALPPTDGIVISGQTTFDESSLTGESRPVKKGPGDEIFTGTTNLTGAITIRITTTAGETMLEKIMRAVSEANGHKAPIEKLAETLTGFFVPMIIYLALIVLAIWMSLAASGNLSHHATKGGGEYFFAIEFAIATLVVACPCGIGLAVPCANAVGTGMVAKEGVLATTGGEAFLGATKVGTVVFDKTGTLTVGKSTVTDKQYFAPASPAAEDVSITESFIDGMVKETERGSTHPLAQGIVGYLDDNLLDVPQMEVISTEEIAGRGISASVQSNGKTYDVIIGNASMMADYSVDLSTHQTDAINTWSMQAKSVVLVAICQSSAYNLRMAYALADPPRESTRPALDALRKMGLQVKMLSGDNETTARAVGSMVGISSEDVIAGVSPTGKAEIITFLQQTSPPSSTRPSSSRSDRTRVMFVGDGLNDSVALAAADVSIAMGHGSQATLAGSDFVLLSSSLAALPVLIRLSRKIIQRQRMNLAWACVFNVVCLPIAAGAFYALKGVRLTPVWSAVIMACSSLSVVCSSLALRWGI